MTRDVWSNISVFKFMHYGIPLFPLTILRSLNCSVLYICLTHPQRRCLRGYRLHNLLLALNTITKTDDIGHACYGAGLTYHFYGLNRLKTINLRQRSSLRYAFVEGAIWELIYRDIMSFSDLNPNAFRIHT